MPKLKMVTADGKQVVVDYADKSGMGMDNIVVTLRGVEKFKGDVWWYLVREAGSDETWKAYAKSWNDTPRAPRPWEIEDFIDVPRGQSGLKMLKEKLASIGIKKAA